MKKVSPADELIMNPNVDCHLVQGQFTHKRKTLYPTRIKTLSERKKLQ